MTWRRLTVLGIAAAGAFIVLVSLGIWQVQRLQWKEALIARVNERIDATPIPAPGPESWDRLDAIEAEYQPVSVEGRFLHGDETHVFTVLNAPHGPYGGLGYLVLTPLETSGGWIVYVNRGFVPDDKKDPATRMDGQTDGVVSVVGLLRAPRPQSWLSADDDRAGNVWFSRDPQVFAEWSGLPLASVAPYTIDSRFDPELPGGLPQGGETLVTFPNNHLGYALTWFGLALGLAGVFFVYVRGRFSARR